MRVLVTGGTGYIGSAIVRALRAAGHTPLVVTQSDDNADRARTLGAEPVAGDLRESAELASLAEVADAVIHAANTNSADAAEVDTNATRAFLGALGGSGRAFVYTSGVWVLGTSGERVLDEVSPLDPTPLVAWRAGVEAEVAAARGLRGIVVRPAVVFGDGNGIPAKVASGEFPVIGDGTQRWPLVHVRDLADLYVRALQAPVGSVLHGVATAATMREIALLGAAARGAPAASGLPLAEARERLGAFADALALDQIVSAARTRALVGWKPRRLSIVEELLQSEPSGTRIAA